MKAFIFSVILFSIILSVIIINSIYIHNVCREMYEIIDSQADTSEKAELLCTKWDSCRHILTFSIHEEDIEKMDDLTQGLKSAVDSYDRAEIQKHLILIKKLIATFKKNEEISLEGIG